MRYVGRLVGIGVLVGLVLLPAKAANPSSKHAAVPPFESLVKLYDYDQSRPLGLEEHNVTATDGITVHDISYASPKRGRVTAYLVLPAGPGPFPAAVFLPGLYGGRNDDLRNAQNLAAHGLAALLIDPPHVRQDGPRLISCTSRDRLPFIQYVVEVRRGIDVLTARADIAATRIAVVGFSYGSAIAAVLSGVDKRLKAVVIDSGRAYNSRFFRSQCARRLRKKKLAAYTRTMSFSDAVPYVSHATPTALLIQNGTRDPFTPRREALLIQQAASEPKTVKMYDAGHELNDAAFEDRAAWLASQLGFQL